MPKATLHVGDAKETLSRLPESSVQCCVTSPPYWGLRSYLDSDDPKKHNELGAEETPEEYVSNLCDVFDEVRRVLREDGTCWLNLGDSYAANRGYQVSDQKHPNHDYQEANAQSVPSGLKEKDLCMIPSRVALELQRRGWWVRSRICWEKKNAMPESVTDRPTSSHEYIFLLSQQKQYFYDNDAIREPAKGTNLHDVTGTGHDAPGQPAQSGNRERRYEQNRDGEDGVGHSIPWEGYTRNKRDVWSINTASYPDTHYAVFPKQLVETPILAGTSAAGQCPECGAPWQRVVEREDEVPEYYEDSPFNTDHTDVHMEGRAQGDNRTTRVPTDNWRLTCDCNAGDPEPQTVLDPFFGAGTSGVVSLAKGRHYIGIDLSRDYTEMAADRIRQDAPLMNDVEIID